MTDPRDARDECYQQVRDCMKEGIQKYYQEFPERMMDERSEMAIARSVEGLKNIFATLDKFQITNTETNDQKNTKGDTS